MARHDGNLAVAAGMDDCCQAAEEIFFLEFVNELMFEFIRHQIAAIGIRTNTQGILHIDKVLMTDAVPEGFLVSIGCTAFLFLSLVSYARLFYNRRRSRLSHLGIQPLLAFQAVDFFSQVHHIFFHLVVPGRVFSGNHTVIIAHRIQEILGGFPEVLSLFTQC